MRIRSIVVPLVMTVAMGLMAPTPAQAASGCGFGGWFPCRTTTVASDPVTRTPGDPVDPVAAFSQNTNGGDNDIVGDVPLTASLGRVDRGVVPVVGSVAAKADDGAYVLYESALTDRIVDLMIYSPKVGGNVPARVQLPPSWRNDPTRTYPVLTLLHGANEKADYQSWSLYTTVHQTTRDLEAIVVMPSGGAVATYSNFWNYGYRDGKNQWNSWIGTELPQLLERGYRANGKSSIVGISSGGRGALETAFQNPGRYGAAASFSSLIDSQLPGAAQVVQFGSPREMWGSWILNAWEWRAHNPAANIDRLRASGAAIYVSYGDADPIEALTKSTSESFLAKASRGGLQVERHHMAGAGHKWRTWQTEFALALPMVKAGMGL